MALPVDPSPPVFSPKRLQKRTGHFCDAARLCATERLVWKIQRELALRTRHFFAIFAELAKPAALLPVWLARMKDACDHAKPATMCKKPALILALNYVGTSHRFSTPRQARRQLFEKLRNDRRKMAPHIVLFYLALENQGNFSRRTPPTLRNFGERKGVHI